jgi:predicted phage terminase large subunit-like protein
MTLEIESKEDLALLERAFQLEHGKHAKPQAERKPREEIGEYKKGSIERLLNREALIAEKSKRDLRTFIQEGWHVIEPSRPFIGNWHIDAICDHIKALRAGQIDRLLINVPPRTSKSIVCSVMFPAWVWAIDPWARFIYSSYGQSLSRDLAVKFRAVIDSRWYRTNFGQDFHLTTNTIGLVSNSKSGYRLILVPKSSTGRGGDYVVSDDPNKTNDAYSEADREGVNQRWEGSLSSRVEDPLTGRFLVVQQRVHDNDLSGHLLKKGGWTHLMLPMEYVPTRKCQVYIDNKLFFEDPRTEELELLDKNRYNQEWIDKEKGTNVSGKNPELSREKGKFVWSGQFQQDPAPADGAILKASWFAASYYKERPEDLKHRCHKLIQSWDMAFRDNDDSSYVVCQVWGKIEANMYLIHETRARMSFVDTLRAFHRINQEFPTCQEKLVEARANGDAIISMLKGKIPGLIPIEPGNESKIDRAEAISWLVEAGNVRLPDPELYPWVEAVIHELVRFPVGDADDRVDALTQAVKRLAVFSILDGAASPTGVSDGRLSWGARDWSVQGGSGYAHGSPFVRKWGY